MRLRKESEQQTDLTYSQVNKKVQANTMADEDQISVVDARTDSRDSWNNFVDCQSLMNTYSKKVDYSKQNINRLGM